MSRIGGNSAKWLAGAVAAAALWLAARPDAGARGSAPTFETVGKIHPVSVPVNGQGTNNGYPALLEDRSGNLWCVWISTRQRNVNDWRNYAEGDAVILRKKTGKRWSEPVILNTNFGVNFAPSLAEDAAGNIFVVWSSRRKGRYRLYSRRVGRDLSLGSEIQVLPAGKLEGRPTLAADGAGRLWLAAQSWSNGSQDIVFYRLENGGWRRMPDAAATPDPEFRPRLAAAPDGAIWCAWDVYSGGKYRVRVRRFDPAGGRWGEPEDVPGDGRLDAYAPDLAVDAEGRVWAAYARNSVYEQAWGRRGPRKGGSPRPTVRLVVRTPHGWRYPAPDGTEDPGLVASGDLPRIQVDERGAVWLFWQSFRGHVNWKVSAAVFAGERWIGPYTFGMDEPVALDGPPKRADQRAAFVIGAQGHALVAYERGRGVFRNRDIYLREVRLAEKLEPVSRPRLARFPGAALEPFERPVRRAPRRMAIHDATGARRRLFLGDLHNHLLIDDGHEGSVDQLFHIHRDRFAMDFAATTSHGDSNKLLISELAHNDALTESLLEEHAFVTIPGFEWTQGDFVVPRAGHRHVIYETIGGPLFRPTEGHSDSIREFVDLMAKTNGLLFAHHITRPYTGGTDWSYVNVSVEPCVEICSSWGRFEYYRNPGHIRGPEVKGCSVQDVWRMGLRLGVIGGSDGHNLFGDRIQGLTGVYATELTRAALFEALRKRHVYATTGAPIELDFRVNGRLMGSEIEAVTGPVIEAEVRGTRKLLAVEVVKYCASDGPEFRTVHRAALNGSRAKLWWRDPEFRGDSLYYLRVTQEVEPALAEKYRSAKENPFPTEMAWSSPVWVDEK